MQSALIKSQFLSSDVEKVYFEILLTEKFPYQAPQVYCKTKIGFPTINDYRDVLEAVIQKEWNPSMTIYETVQMIPEFVSDLLLEMTKDEDTIHDWVQSKNYKVHTGQSYHVTDWGVNFFKVREETETLDGFQYHERYIAVYENSFLLFEPDKKRKRYGKAGCLCHPLYSRKDLQELGYARVRDFHLEEAGKSEGTVGAQSRDPKLC
jgi:hypothetical protein